MAQMTQEGSVSCTTVRAQLFTGALKTHRGAQQGWELHGQSWAWKWRKSGDGVAKGEASKKDRDKILTSF